MNKSNGQAHKHLSHRSNKIKISVRHQAWCGGSSMSHSQIDWFLNWLHFIFFRLQLGGELDSLWDECILEKMAETDLLSLPYTIAFAPATAGSLPQSLKIAIFLVLYPARAHAHMTRPVCNTSPFANWETKQSQRQRKKLLELKHTHNNQ